MHASTPLILRKSRMRTITWHLYRNTDGAWVVYTDGPLNFTNPDKRWVEKRLMKYGVRPAEIEKLFHDEAEKGEGIITVPIGLDRVYEDGLFEQTD
jgi:hypothetical protein